MPLSLQHLIQDFCGDIVIYHKKNLNMIPKRYGHNMCFINKNKVLLFGGCDADGDNNLF